MSAPRRIGSFIGMLILALGLALPGAAGAAADNASGHPVHTWWTVLAGGEVADGAGGAQLHHFYPARLVVNAGDIVEWRLNARGPCSVTFPALGMALPNLRVPEEPDYGRGRERFNPLAALPQGGATYDGTSLAGSGRLVASPGRTWVYRLTFTAPGVYAYASVFDPQMRGTVVVQPTGTPRPRTPGQVAAEAQAQLEADRAAAR